MSETSYTQVDTRAMGEDLEVDLTPPPTMTINNVVVDPEAIKAAWAERTGAATSEPGQPNPHHIPPFEGEQVHFAKLKLTSVSSVEIDDEVFKMDQLVRLVIEGRVTRIDHVVNERTGKMERIQTVKAVEATVTDWTS